MPTKNMLSEEQRREYQERGYLVVPGLFSAKELAVWHEQFLDIVEGRIEPAKDMLVMRDVMVARGAVTPGSASEAIAKIQDFHNDPVLFDGYAKHPRLLEWVEDIIGPDIKSIHSMLINKPPGVDGRHPLHQDLLYFPFRPADLIVATWTALEPCTVENGCLVAVPGSHKGELLKHENMEWEYQNFGYFGAEGVGAHEGRVHLEMKAGDSVFFHPLLLHGSGTNRSAGFRRAISCHYASAKCRYLPEQLGLNHRPYLLVKGQEHPGGI
ncbi:MAG: phytanoyl-CoA dioxygenase family protein [Deltaproteobacteria bacterium]|nr:phytanoyl-CoA dioxygenase family protein [Deltaproteobacteria bacterium]MBW2725337.1 phytanoyl-CoA dioxygenase family protein [Deltaproteobacteria bacterium]